MLVSGYISSQFTTEVDRPSANPNQIMLNQTAFALSQGGAHLDAGGTSRP